MPKQNGYKPKNKKYHNSNFTDVQDRNTTNDPRNSPDNYKEEFAAEWREKAIADINKQSNDRKSK
ncbi:hypothetical protein ACWV26_12370 [Rummeliibacillus sp. JY-2-4R]